MFAQIVRFTSAPEGVPEEERPAWLGLTIPVTEFTDAPHHPCFTTAGALFQALSLAGYPEFARVRYGEFKATSLILIEGDDVEVVDDHPVFWTNIHGTATLHRLPMVIPGARRISCGRTAADTKVIALSLDWYETLRFGEPIHPIVWVPDDVVHQMGAMRKWDLCGTCLRVERSQQQPQGARP